MARSRETKIELTAYDDLFQTDESRAEAKLSKIRDIPLSQIDEFPDHPFKVLMDEDMEQLVESIKRNGVMTPATVRLKEDGRYELVSGHRRKKACELAGLETLKCEVKELTRDEAIIVMVESNLQRSTILPSEKAFAYKMRLEAMDRQGQRSDFQNNTITIRHTVTSCNLDGKHIQIAQDTTKTKSSMRTLPLVPAFKEKLLKLKEQQEEYRRVCGRCYNKKYLEYICVDEMGTLISPHYLTASFPKLLEKNNLRHIRFHDLRHSCASLLLANGVPMKQIQEWLGHSDFSTTANVYAHLGYNSKLSSADAMVNGLRGALEVIS